MDTLRILERLTGSETWRGSVAERSGVLGWRRREAGPGEMVEADLSGVAGRIGGRRDMSAVSGGREADDTRRERVEPRRREKLDADGGIESRRNAGGVRRERFGDSWGGKGPSSGIGSGRSVASSTSCSTITKWFSA